MANIKIQVRENPYYYGNKILDGYSYRLLFWWNITTEQWQMNMEGNNNDVAIDGIPLLPGKDLFAPYGYRELGQLWIIDNSGADAAPEFYGMGSRWTLEYVPLADI